MRTKLHFSSTRLLRLVRLALLISLGCAMVSIGSAQLPTPSPPPCTPDACPTAAIIFSDGTWLPDWSLDGLFQPVATTPMEVVTIQLRFPLTLAHTQVIVGVLDGGTVLGPTELTLGSDATASFRFQVSEAAFNPYRVELIAGRGTLFTELRFQVTTPPSPTAHLGNISARAFVQTGDDVIIGGFIITGTGQKRVIVRAIGPSLAQHGITNPLQNPRLELHDHTGALIASNDDWMNAPNQQDIIHSGLAPSSNLESAILTSLNPGSYTAIVRGVNNWTGIGLVEVYDLDQLAGSKLANISTRSLVQTGDNVMIGGFIIVNEPAHVMIRAIGPSLTQLHVPGALANPQLELHDAYSLIGRNDNWQQTQVGGVVAGNQVTSIRNSGLAPTSAVESTIIATLQPGSYTAILRGVNNTSGNALVEVYDLQ
jgi:hypothetical protein